MNDYLGILIIDFWKFLIAINIMDWDIIEQKYADFWNKILEVIGLFLIFLLFIF